MFWRVSHRKTPPSVSLATPQTPPPARALCYLPHSWLLPLIAGLNNTLSALFCSVTHLVGFARSSRLPSPILIIQLERTKYLLVSFVPCLSDPRYLICISFLFFFLYLIICLLSLTCPFLLSLSFLAYVSLCVSTLLSPLPF